MALNVAPRPEITDPISLTRRTVLGWLVGVSGWLTVGLPVEAKPRNADLYANLYADIY